MKNFKGRLFEMLYQSTGKTSLSTELRLTTKGRCIIKPSIWERMEYASLLSEEIRLTITWESFIITEIKKDIQARPQPSLLLFMHSYNYLGANKLLIFNNLTYVIYTCIWVETKNCALYYSIKDIGFSLMEEKII